MMPSCVVKSCKNHSGKIKKSHGITFHRFPLSKETWNNDWVQIIRLSRKESDWIPSKSSVICSIHFEESDLYTTKGGLLRTVANAVPKKFLYDTSSNEVQRSDASTSTASDEISSEASDNPELFAEANTSGASHGVPLEASNIQVGGLAETNTSSALPESVLVFGEPSLQGYTFLQPYQVLLNSNPIYYQSYLPQVELLNVSSTTTPEITTPETTTPETTTPETTTPETTTLETTTPVVELGQPLPAKERVLTDRLIKLQDLSRTHQSKIKVLNQKVKRLQSRNKTLKALLKSRKKT